MSNPYFHVSIVKTVAADDYDCTDADLSVLVATKVKAGRVDEGVADTYLGVLVRRSQKAVNSSKDYMEAIDKAHKGMYAVAKKAEITPEIEDLTKKENRTERDRRTVFARTAATTLRKWVEAGGDLLALIPADVRKTALTTDAKKLAEKAADPAENTPEAKVAKRLAGLITALNQVENAGERAKLAEQCRAAIHKGLKA
jgi:hypothetical protein